MIVRSSRAGRPLAATKFKYFISVLLGGLGGAARRRRGQADAPARQPYDAAPGAVTTGSIRLGAQPVVFRGAALVIADRPRQFGQLVHDRFPSSRRSVSDRLSPRRRTAGGWIDTSGSFILTERRGGLTVPAASAAEAAVEAVFREEWGRITASLIAMTGDWDLAEECAQDAFTRALSAWDRDGVPERPGAWLTTAARNRAIDVLRRRANEAAKLQQALMLAPDPGPPTAPDGDISDDRLRLIFTCCHPALPPEARVALTLRTLTGLTTPEIARAFLVPEPTMAQRLVRAKKKIQAAAIPYRVPPASLLPERLSGVLAVLYLLFNEGYRASSGADLVRPELIAEAIRLTRLLLTLQPGEPEIAGLLALMLLNDSRRGARTDASGDPVPLPEQDRTRWDRDAIDEGLRLLAAAADREQPGPYLLQAEIAACHASAARPEDTDWAAIARLYAQLAILLPSPVVELNRAVAVGMADGPAAGLAIANDLAARGELPGYHLLPAVRADFLRRLGRPAEAADGYRAAIELAGTDSERRYLETRLTEVSDK
jgi:RNA polymerase sigma-70 factor (ECF subfamily)